LDQKWYASGKSYRDLGSFYGKPNPYFLRWLNHPSYDRFWQALVPYGREFAKVDIPVLTITGYYAAGEAGALYYFSEHHRHNPHAEHTLLIGPYDDGVTERGAQSLLRGYQVDAAALVDLRELRYQWFDHVLKGAPLPGLLQDRVNYEVMGGNEWRHVPSIEAMDRGGVRFYLDPTLVGASHHLTERGASGARPSSKSKGLKGSRAKASDGRPKGGGSKTKAAPAFVELVVNLADRSDANSNWTAAADIASKSVDVRNATAYVSDPLPKPLELQGEWAGRLDVTVNKMDVDLRIAAYELLASGDYVQLFEPYALRASYAKDRVHRRLLRAGERQPLAFKLDRLTSRKLQAGSRLVLVIGVNKRADQEINYGTADDVSAVSLEDDDSKVPVKIRWWGDSYFEVPVRR
jgi:predicted acyl esterase